MAIARIDHADDPRLADFRLNERGLADRAERRDDAGAGRFLAEGDLVVDRALAAGCRPDAVLADDQRLDGPAAGVVERITRDWPDVPVYLGGDAVRRLVTGLGMPHPVVALFHRPARPDADELAAAADRLVVVEGLDNPANVGAVVRNGAALGWDGLLLDHTSADPLARRALRVAMGTTFSLPHARTRDLVGVVARLGERGVAVYALTPDPDATPIDEVRPTGRRAVLVGSERSGLDRALLSVAHERVRIPMAGGVDSLNAAAATAVACYALAR